MRRDADPPDRPVMPHDAVPPALISNLLLFGRVLRAAGLDVHHERLLDAVQALEWVGVQSRADVRATLRSLLVHRHEDLPLFDEAFDLFFRAHGRPRWTCRCSRSASARGWSPGATRARRSGSTSKNRHRRRPRPRRSRSAPTARPTCRAPRTSRTSPPPSSRPRGACCCGCPGSRAPGARDGGSARGAATSIWRACFEPNVMRGGELIELPRRGRRDAPRPIVVLADVSGSMERYSRMLLSFANGLTRSARARGKLRLRDAADARARCVAATGGHRVVSRMVRDVQDWGGGTRIGEALRTFNTTLGAPRHAPRSGRADRVRRMGPRRSGTARSRARARPAAAAAG